MAGFFPSAFLSASALAAVKVDEVGFSALDLAAASAAALSASAHTQRVSEDTIVSSSFATTQGAQDTRLTAIEAATGSYALSANTATTGSNTFTGETIISSSQLLTLQPIDPAPGTASTGSLIVSGSPAVLYIWNGSWSAV